MIDIFEPRKLDLNNLTCHSGGAEGSDLFFEKVSEKYGVKVKAYSYKTNYHKSPNKVEISDDDYNQGVLEINKANYFLNRYGIHKFMNLLARNWPQVKYSKQIFAIGTIVDPGKKGQKGFYNKSKYQVVDGGTGYSIQMSINHIKDVCVFDQKKEKWHRWSYSSMEFVEIENPKIKVQDFAGIGTREINPVGMKAIEDLYDRTFNKTSDEM
jgi:hypothetical protein